MAKRKTKQQREDEQRFALLRRIVDVYHGACGDEWEGFFDNPENTYAYATGETISRVASAISRMFNIPDGNFLCAMWNAEHYDNPAKLTDFLFEHGVRADTWMEQEPPHA